MLTPWTAIATQETEVFILRDKSLGFFCDRSSGTDMFEVLEKTYHRRLYSYKDRFRAAKETKSYHGMIPLNRKNGPFSPTVTREPEAKESNDGEIVISMSSLLGKKVRKNNNSHSTKKKNHKSRQKNSPGSSHHHHDTIMGDGGGDEETDQLEQLRKMTEMFKRKEERQSALKNPKQHFKFDADQQNRRSIALDVALDACLELHLTEERKKILE